MEWRNFEKYPWHCQALTCYPVNVTPEAVKISIFWGESHVAIQLRQACSGDHVLRFICTTMYFTPVISIIFHSNSSLRRFERFCRSGMSIIHYCLIISGPLFALNTQKIIFYLDNSSAKQYFINFFKF